MNSYHPIYADMRVSAEQVLRSYEHPEDVTPAQMDHVIASCHRDLRHVADAAQGISGQRGVLDRAERRLRREIPKGKVAKFQHMHELASSVVALCALLDIP